ncbi:MAG: aminotransferase class I/II-fold pyridoxal phosphate-dependent enzyme [marine benthic group bacterium]|nr:aminotransferase class I/II-fold pyridoxal phosphate-dependent enzyme [Candidatus Benthicola marisminoris]
MHLFEKCANFTVARDLRAAGLYPYFQRIESSADTEVVIDGHRKVMIGSNNYMGLTHDPRIIEAAKAALDKYGSGNTGSRFLNGNLDLHDQLEEDLADFVGKEAALVFSTGYQTNLGTIGALLGRNDTAFLDKLDHACIQDGARLGWGEIQRFRHADFEHLEKLLDAADPGRGKMIIVDGVYSMEGDIVDLPNLVPLARRYSAAILVDDAHSLGVLGPLGAGTAAHFDLTDEVDLITGTFSKSLASIGGFVAGDAVVVDFLRNNARSQIFSASMPPASVATVLKAVEIIRSEPERQERLWANTHRMMKELTEMGFDIGPTETPVVPILIGPMEKTFLVWRELFDAGVFTNPVVPPAVPEGSCRLRTSYMATHTDEQLDFVLEHLLRVGKKFGVLGQGIEVA